MWKRKLPTLVASLIILFGAVEFCIQHRATTISSFPFVAVQTAPWEPAPYEPVQFAGSDAATPAQKAVFQRLLNFAIAEMDRQHVSSRRINQFLWEMHFFVPVRYKPIDCSGLTEEQFDYGRPLGTPMPVIEVAKFPIAVREADFVAMGHAMTNTHNAFPSALPMFNEAAQLTGGEISLDNIHRSDRLQTYTLELWNFMMAYNSLAKGLDYHWDRDHHREDLKAEESQTGQDYFDPSFKTCFGSRGIIGNDGLSVSSKYIDGFFGGTEPEGTPDYALKW